MLAHKEPTVKENPNRQITRACAICGFEISDQYCSSSNKNLCIECGGDVCFINRKHIVKNGYCLTCGKEVKNQIEYQRWINSKLPFCDTKIEKVD